MQNSPKSSQKLKNPPLYIILLIKNVGNDLCVVPFAALFCGMTRRSVPTKLILIVVFLLYCYTVLN